jgi:FlaA1/EpsC-like NDP-sugar epimerase
MVHNVIMSGKLSHAAAASEATISAFLRRQFATPKPLPDNIDLSNQVAIITGSNTGVGFEAARQLHRSKLSHMILAVRSQTRGDAAAKKLQQEFPNSHVSVWLLDMTSYVRYMSLQIVVLRRHVSTWSF